MDRTRTIATVASTLAVLGFASVWVASRPQPESAEQSESTTAFRDRLASFESLYAAGSVSLPHLKGKAVLRVSSPGQTAVVDVEVGARGMLRARSGPGEATTESAYYEDDAPRAGMHPIVAEHIDAFWRDRQTGFAETSFHDGGPQELGIDRPDYGRPWVTIRGPWLPADWVVLVMLHPLHQSQFRVQVYDQHELKVQAAVLMAEWDVPISASTLAAHAPEQLPALWVWSPSHHQYGPWPAELERRMRSRVAAQEELGRDPLLPRRGPPTTTPSDAAGAGSTQE